jgi:hypothetical protein
VGDTLYLCTRKAGLLGKRKVFGARLECKELMLPNINFGYEEERPVVPEVHLDLKFSRYDQEALGGRRFDRESLSVDESEESVYLFGVHNPVDTLWVSFRVVDEGLSAEIHARFNFEHEGRIGGVFEHTLRARVVIEDRP